MSWAPHPSEGGWPPVAHFTDQETEAPSREGCRLHMIHRAGLLGFPPPSPETRPCVLPACGRVRSPHCVARVPRAGPAHGKGPFGWSRLAALPRVPGHVGPCRDAAHSLGQQPWPSGLDSGSAVRAPNGPGPGCPWHLLSGGQESRLMFSQTCQGFTAWGQLAIVRATGEPTLEGLRPLRVVSSPRGAERAGARCSRREAVPPGRRGDRRPWGVTKHQRFRNAFHLWPYLVKVP